MDEEIDEELAFTEEDKQQMAQLRQGPVDGNDISEADELTRDDFSDDVRSPLCKLHVCTTTS